METKSNEEKHLSSLRSIDDSKSPIKIINTLSDNLSNLNLNTQLNSLNTDSFTTKNFKNKRNIFINDHNPNESKNEKQDANKDKNYLNFHRKIKFDNPDINYINKNNDNNNNYTDSNQFKKMKAADEKEDIMINKVDLLKSRFKNKKINFNDFDFANKNNVKATVFHNKEDPNINKIEDDLSEVGKVKMDKKDAKKDCVIQMNEKELLSSIFANSDKSVCLYNLSNKIANVKQIKNLLKFLLQNKSEEANDFIFNFLNKNFKEHRINLDLFNSISIKKPNSIDTLYLSDVIIEKLLSSNSKINNNSKLIFLETIFSNLGCNKKSFEIIFQKLRFLFKNTYENNKFNSNNNNHSLLLFNSINILKSIFAIESTSNFPKNYIYFNESNGLKIFNNKQIDENNNYKIKIIGGFSFFLSFKLETALMRESEKESNLINLIISDSTNLNSNISISLIIKREKLFLKINQETINTSLHEFNSDWNFMFFSFKNFKTSNNEKIIVNYIINNNNHINQIFIDEKNFKNAEIKEFNLFENLIGYSTSLVYLNSAVTDKNILNFRDFSKENFPFGIYSESKLQKFLNKSSNKIFSFYQKEKSKKKKTRVENSDNFNFNDVTYSEINYKINNDDNKNKKIKNQVDSKAKIIKSDKKPTEKLRSSQNLKASFSSKYSLKSNISKQTKNTLKEIIDKTEIFLAPFRSSIVKIKNGDLEKTDDKVHLNCKEAQRNVLLDIKRNCDFEFFNVERNYENNDVYKNKNFNNNKINSGVSSFYNIRNDLESLDTQGINNLIPILDLINTESKYDNNNNNNFNKENLLYFMKLIYLILYDREKNMKNILENNFFKNASFYIETFDKSLFSGDLADVFIDIFKHLFLYNSKNQTYLCFLENFIANEKILLKFEITKQIEIWEIVYNYLNESKELLKYFQIEKLLLILKEYDKLQYFEYCCKNHRESLAVFKLNLASESPKISEKIMNPSLNHRIYHILMILFLILNESLLAENDEELSKFIMLVKFLILDFSPCLKKGILMILNECFAIPNKNLDKVLIKLEKEGFLNILIHIYSSSCIDLRIKIIDLIKNLISIEAKKNSNSNLNGTEALYYKKLFPFLKEKLLDFRLTNSKLDLNLNPIVKELISDKAAKKIENEFIKQFNFFSENNFNKEEKNLNFCDAEKNLFGFDSKEKKIEQNNFDPHIQDLSETIENLKIIDKEEKEQIILDIPAIPNNDLNMKKCKKKKFQFNLDLDFIVPKENEGFALNEKIKSPNNQINLDNKNNNEELKHSNMPFKKEAKIYDFPLSIDSCLKNKPTNEIAFKSQENFYPKKNQDSLALEEFQVPKTRTFTKKKLGKPLNLGINTEAINELYLFGGDKHQSNQTLEDKQINFTEKVKLLAQHCVDYMEKADEAENCGFFRSEVLFKEKDCCVSEINESLSKYRREKNNEKINIIVNDGNNKNNYCNENEIELEKNNDDVYNKINNDKLNENVANAEEINFTSCFSNKKFILETNKFAKGKSSYNSFSAKPPLPTSKNKDSKSFSFGSKPEQIASFPIMENPEFTSATENLYLNKTEKNSSNPSGDLESIVIQENTSAMLTLPKNKKSFLRNKKAMNLSLDVDSFGKPESESIKSIKEDSESLLENKNEKAISYKSKISSSESFERNSRFSNKQSIANNSYKNRIKNDFKITEIVEENVNDDLNEIETPKAAINKRKPDVESNFICDEEIKIYEELPIVNKDPSNFANKPINKNEDQIKESYIDYKTSSQQINQIKPINEDPTNKSNESNTFFSFNCEIKIRDLIYSINPSDIEAKIAKLSENRKEAKKSEGSLDNPSFSLEANLIQLYQSLINWLLDMNIENQENEISERFSFKSKNQKYPQDLFEKNLSGELRKKAYAFQETCFSYSASSNNNSNYNYNNNENKNFNNKIFNCAKKERNYLIKNPEVIQILIRFTQTTNLRFSYKFLIEINELICLNSFNCFVLYKNEFFFKWLRELIFSAFLIHNKNLSEEGKISQNAFEASESNLQNKEIHSLFMLGKKLFVKIILEISANFDFDEISKKLNCLFNWAIHLKHFRNLEYEEIELTSFVFEILNEIFLGVKEKYDFNLGKFQEAFNNVFYLNIDLKNNDNNNNFGNLSKLSNETLKILKENYFSDSKINLAKQQAEDSKNSIYAGMHLSNLFNFQNNFSVSLLNFINFSFFYYEFLTFFNISKNPFVCIKSLYFENKLRNSSKKSKLIPDVIRENNLFHILSVFQKENFFFNDIQNENSEETLKQNSFQCDLGLQRNFNKVFYSLNSLNKSFLDVISTLWKNNLINKLFANSKKDECSLEIIKQEKIDFMIKDYVIDKENKNCFLNSLTILFIEFPLVEKGKDSNDFLGLNGSNLIYLLSEENCFKLGLLNEELKFKIKTLLNINKKGDLNVFNSLNIKEKVIKTRENYTKNKKSFYIEFEKVMKEINSSGEFANESFDFNTNSKDEKLNKKKLISKNPDQAQEAKHKSIYLIEIINSIILLKLENLKDEFYNLNNNSDLNEIKKETIYYLEQYESFLLFLSFASSNIKSKNNNNHELYNNKVIEIILYSIIHIYENIQVLKQADFLLNDNFMQENYCVLLKNILNVMHSIYERISEKKKKKSFMNKLIPKKSNKDLMNCAVYKIITDYLSVQIQEPEKNKTEKRQLLSTQFSEEFKKIEINFLADFLKSNNELDYLLLRNSDFIRKRIERNFDLDSYLNILSHRTKAAEKSKTIDLNFIFRNYRATNLILYNISRNSSPNAKLTAKHKSLSDNVISKNLKTEENKLKNFISAQNLNKLNTLTLTSDNDLNNYEGLEKNLLEVEIVLAKFYFKRKFEDFDLVNKIKKVNYSLFTWCGLWAEKEIANFSNSNSSSKISNSIKWKVINHTTKFFYKPLLKAIIDFPRHFPRNSKFDADVLFLEEVKNTKRNSENLNQQKPEFTYENENAAFKIQINFKKNEKLEIEKYKESINQNLSSIEINEIMQNNLRTNCFLWSHYQKLNAISDKIINLPFDIFNKINPEEELKNQQVNDASQLDFKNKNILESIYNLQQFKDIYNIFEVCIVKITTHFKCFLKFTSTGFDIFSNYTSEDKQEDLNFNEDFNNNDKEYKSENCFGSFIKQNSNQHFSSKFYRNFNFNEIHLILKRNYYLTDFAVEIFISNKTHYLNFINKDERKKFLRIVKANINKLRKIKIERINASKANNQNQKEKIFGFSNSKNKENSSEKELNKLTTFNSSLTINDPNSFDNNLQLLNSNENISVGLKTQTTKYAGYTNKKANKNKKHETIGYENLAIANSFSKVFKKEKKSKKANSKIFNNSNNNNNNNNQSEKEYFKSLKVNQIIDQWNENHSNKSFSNFELLLLLNILANRSFTDVTQYPVFPWIISDYENSYFKKNFNKNTFNNKNNLNKTLENSSEINLKKYLRDLSSPMGLLSDNIPNSPSENRKNSYLNSYKSMLEDYEAGESTQTPYFYGSLYSNVIYVSYYLIRLFPFSKLAVEFQGGKFDCYARIFKSVAESFCNASSITGDVRELVPEFFFMPELLQNLNNLNLNRKFHKKIFDYENKNYKNNKIENDVNLLNNYDVALPLWAEGNASYFTARHKEILESAEVSAGLGDWIDLIFGFSQAGKNAEKAKNVFFADAYLINNPSFNLNELSEEERILKLKFIEFGLIPKQMINSKIRNKVFKNALDEALPNRKNLKIEFNYISNKNKKDNCSSNEGRIFSFNEIEKFKSDFKRSIKLLKMRYVQENNSLICIFNNNCVYQILLPGLSNKEAIDFNVISRKIISENLRFKEKYDFESTFIPFSLKMPEFYEEYDDEFNSAEKIIYISKNGKYVAQGGYYNGKIRLIQLDSNNKNNIRLISTQKQANVYLLVDNSEKYVFTGSQNGFVTIFTIGDKFNIWKKTKTLKDHDSKITCISSNDYLNILASSCEGGKINLYTIPKFELFRTIDLNNVNNFQRPFNINNIFISSTPLACVAIYCRYHNKILTYSINGEKISEEDLRCNLIDEKKNEIIGCSEIFKDENFSDNIIFSYSHGKLQIRKFPYLQQIKYFDVFKGNEIESDFGPYARSLIKISNSNLIYYEFSTNSINLLRIEKD